MAGDGKCFNVPPCSTLKIGCWSKIETTSHITLHIFGGEIEHVFFYTFYHVVEHYADLLNSIWKCIKSRPTCYICVSCFCGNVLFLVSGVVWIWGGVGELQHSMSTWLVHLGSPGPSHNARTWICLSKISNSWTLDGPGERSISFPWHWDGFFWKNWGETEGIDWVKHQSFAVSTLVL